MPILPFLLALVLAMPVTADTADQASSDSVADAFVCQTHGRTSTDSTAPNGTAMHGGTSAGSIADGADSCATDGGI